MTGDPFGKSARFALSRRDQFFRHHQQQHSREHHCFRTITQLMFSRASCSARSLPTASRRASPVVVDEGLGVVENAEAIVDDQLTEASIMAVDGQQPAPIVHEAAEENSTGDESEEDDDFIAESFLEALNPVDGYHPPVDPTKKGELQEFVENDNTLKPARKMSFLLMCASSHLNFCLQKQEPYASYLQLCKENKHMKRINITKRMVAGEINRRNDTFKANIKNKSLNEFLEELQSTALTDEEDQKYIKYQERELRKSTKSKVNDLKAHKDPQKQKDAPMVMQDRMRLILTLYDDEVLEAYRKSQEVMTRAQLDARNSDASHDDFYTLAATKFNNTEWKATSTALPELHGTFEESKEWPKRKEYTIDRDKIKSIFSWEKQKLNRIINNYGKSGAGAGELDDDEQLQDGDSSGSGNQYWGHFDIDLARTKGGDDRANFLRGDPPDVLFWWHVLDELDLLQMTCVKFNLELAASSDRKIASVAGKPCCSPRDSVASTAQAEAIASVSKSIHENNVTINIMSLRKTIMSLRQTIHNLGGDITKLNMEKFSERAMQNPQYVLYLSGRIKELEEQLAMREKEMADMEREFQKESNSKAGSKRKR